MTTTRTFTAMLMVQEVDRFVCQDCGYTNEDGGFGCHGSDKPMTPVKCLVCPFGCQGGEFFQTKEGFYEHLEVHHVRDLLGRLQ